MLDDAALLRRYVNTRAEADFEELVRRHLDGVYSAALRRLGGDTHLAKDVTQQVFSALAQKAAALSRHPILAGWLYTTTRNLAANAVRSEQRRQAREKEAQMMSTMNSEPVNEADWGRVAPVLDAVIDQLSESDRTAVLLRFVDRRPFAEIGAALRLTEDAARMRIDRALEKLRLLLKRRGIISSSVALEAAMATHVVSAAPAGLAVNVAGAAFASGPAILTAGAGVANLLGAAKFATGIATLTLLLATVGTTGYLLGQIHQRRAALAAENLELAADQRNLRRLTQEYQETGWEPAAIPPVALAAEAATGLPGTGGAAGEEGRRFLQAFPQVRGMILAAVRTQFDYVYDPFFRTAGLTAGQRNRAEEAMLDATLENIGLTPGGGLQLSLGQPSADQLGPIMGDQLYRQFRNYQRLLPAQTIALQVATEAAYASEPLSRDQADRLAQIVASSSPSYQNGADIDLGGLDWNAVLSQASAGLSPAQAEAVQRGLGRFRYQSALGEVRQNQAAAK